MRLYEIITETDHHANAKDLSGDAAAAIKGAVSMPDISINKSNGNPYTQYRFGLAMAGAPDYPTKAAGAFAGDPLLSTYTDAELDIINAAAKMVGAGKVKKLTSNRSEELSNTNTVSPVPQNSGRSLKKKVSESAGITLGQLCTIKTDWPDADFWLVRKNSETLLGKPSKEYNPNHIGIKVLRTDVVLPDYLYYVMINLYQKGYWKQHSQGTTNLKHIRTQDVANLRIG